MNQQIHIAGRNILLFSAFLILVSACTRNTNLTETTAPNALENRTNIQETFQPITDIPIPPGTTLHARNSLILGSGDLLTVRLVMS